MTRTLIAPNRLTRGRARVAYGIVLVAIVVVCSLVFLGPLYWMVTGGLKTAQETAQTPPTWWPAHPDPGNYLTAWHQLSLARLLANTVLYAGGALAFQLVFDVAAAYALSKLRPALGGLVLGMMLATLMIPAAVLIVPQYLTVADLPLAHLNLLNSPWAIWLPSVTNAFSVFLLKRFFDAIPADLLAAAAVDGAGPVRTLVSVVLPISRPVLGVVSIFAVTNVWKDFLWPLLVEPDPRRQTLNVGIWSLSANVPQNILIAALAVAAVPTVAIFLVFQRNIMAGLSAGSIKG
ncbi:MAG TPA: carbohydrate ABC transporter permease [Actinocatenispora sp.]